MSHTITITRLPDAEQDNVEYEVGGTCDQSCTVYRECEEKHPASTDDEISSGEATWHGVEHMDIYDQGWNVPSGECGVTFAHDLSLEADQVQALGTYALDVEWDGDGWLAYIGTPYVATSTPGGGS